MQVLLVHSDPANVTASQLHYIPEKSLLDKPPMEITTVKLSSAPQGFLRMVRRWCCTEGQCPAHPRAVPSRVGSPPPPVSHFGHLTEQYFKFL